MENTGKKTAAAILRQKAEDSLKKKPSKSGSPLSESDSLKLVHELQVHQIELELQNEELLLAKSAALDTAEKYTELYDFAPSGYFTISKKDEIIELNICGAQMLGKERSRLKKRQLGFFISDDTKPIYKLFIEKVFKSKIKESCEVTLSADGRAPLYVYVTGIVTENGEQCLITMVDITAQKRADEALLDSHWRLKNIIEGTHVGTWEWNVQTGETVFNETWAEIVGYTLDELSPISIKTWEALVHPDDRKHSGELLDRHFSGELPNYNCECRMKHKDGHWVWVLDCGRIITRTVDDKPLMMFGTHTDITERKLAEMGLRESEERYRLLFESSSDALFLIATDTGMVVKANSIASELYGYEPDELLTKKSMDLSAEPEETSRLTQKAQTASDQVLRIPLRLHRKKDGTVFPVEVTARSFPLKERHFLLVSIRDITERKQAEAEKAELEVQNRQLQKAESLGRMAGAIAHHFNNQLYAVMGNLEMAMDDLPLGVNSNERLVSAMQAARKAADVSRLMLTYLGQTPGNQEPIDLSETCRQSLTLLQAATPKGIIINAEFPSSGPVIRADTNQMHQILTNLVNNAWESISDSRGTIALTTKTISHEDIPISNRFPIDWQMQDIDYACLEVSDTGCGVSNKDIDKLFDPFFTTKFTGRGLGLSVVMGIVKAHGGGITVESEPGRGSVFRVFLPVSTEELPCRINLPAISGELQAGKAEKISKIEGGGTMLLVDDDQHVRRMAKIMLTRLGYQVIEAQDGVEALELFQQHQDDIHCVLSDLTMPRMDGWETLAALRKLSPDIPVILSSGYDEAQVMAGEHTEIPTAFLGKPYQIKGLGDTIRRILTAATRV